MFEEGKDYSYSFFNHKGYISEDYTDRPRW